MDDSERALSVRTIGRAIGVLIVVSAVVASLYAYRLNFVNPRTDDEAWVVSQESNSVSVISVSKGIVTDTIYAKAEPMDVVFAGGLAFGPLRVQVRARSGRLSGLVYEHSPVAGVGSTAGSGRSVPPSDERPGV